MKQLLNQKMKKQIKIKANFLMICKKKWIYKNKIIRQKKYQLTQINLKYIKITKI